MIVCHPMSAKPWQQKCETWIQGTVEFTRCFGYAAPPYPVCVDSGQTGADAHVRKWNWESGREAARPVTAAAAAAGTRDSPRWWFGNASRPLRQFGACTLPVPSTPLHELAEQAHLQVSTRDSGAVCASLSLLQVSDAKRRHQVCRAL
jgi:hypothetical protein